MKINLNTVFVGIACFVIGQMVGGVLVRFPGEAFDNIIALSVVVGTVYGMYIYIYLPTRGKPSDN